MYLLGLLFLSSFLLYATEAYRKLLIPDIGIKCVALVLAIAVYPLLMMYGVLVAAAYCLILHRVSGGRP